MTNDPRRDPSWKPEPRKKMLGVPLPSLRPTPPVPTTDTVVESKGSQKSARNAKVTGISFAAVATLIVTLYTAKPGWMPGGGEPEKTEPVEQCATQASLDATKAQVHKQAEQIQKLGELVCAINEGSAGTDWPCSPQDYPPARNPPPKIRTDRSFPK